MEPLPLNDAVEALRRDPTKPVVARVDDLTVELRAVSSSPREVAPGNKRPRELHAGERSAADVVREIGPWEGESLDELLATLSEARRQGGSRNIPAL